MTIRELATYTGLDPADVRRKIHSLRCKGYGVIGGNYGVAITNDFALKAKQMEKMLAHADKMREAAEGMLKEHQELDEVEMYILSMLPKRGEDPEKTLRQFREIEVRDGQIVEI